jgi:tetratricopeptide (TPR) repeat protein
MEPYNWAQVLRHEYTHTVTLGATDNRIQHWMTEGLAVYEEQSPVRWEWVPMLYSAVKGEKGLKLFTMDNLTWGFVRPKKPTDRQLAYAESWWICQYVEETYGHDAILKMIDLCREAKTQDEMIQSVTGKPVSSFYADFVAWCNKKVDAWGYDKETSAKYKKLRDQAEAAKDAKEYDKATDLWEQVIKIRPVDAMPHQRLAGLYLKTKQYDKAIEHLSALDKVEIKDNRFAKQIAVIYKAQKKWPEAEKEALRAVYMSPYDLSAHELLEQISQNTGNANLLVREQRVIPILKDWIEQQKKENSLHGGDDAGDKKPDGT